MGLGIEELLADKQNEILAIAAKHKACNIRVFGSVSRGEANLESDIDFLVEMSGHSLLDRIALIQDLQDLLGRKVDLARIENLHELIGDRVISEAVSI